uniref:Uncharacterized protein n=1 Tax=Anguilla anguilla TaxID=7936 RepID=A0A0E9X3E8_ANGAN
MCTFSCNLFWCFIQSLPFAYIILVNCIRDLCGLYFLKVNNITSKLNGLINSRPTY